MQKALFFSYCSQALDHGFNRHFDRRHHQINVLAPPSLSLSSFAAPWECQALFIKKSAAHIKILIRLSFEIDSIITSRQQRFFFQLLCGYDDNDNRKKRERHFLARVKSFWINVRDVLKHSFIWKWEF